LLNLRGLSAMDDHFARVRLPTGAALRLHDGADRLPITAVPADPRSKPTKAFRAQKMRAVAVMFKGTQTMMVLFAIDGMGAAPAYG